jgi:2,3-bisphosphoglycerate-independent phosphoglycerate mutase
MQDLVRIGSAVEDGSFFQNRALVQACDSVNATGGTLHLLGLLGDGGVHAHDAHVLALVELAQQRGVQRVVLHAMLDGRDTPPQSAMGFLRDALAAIGDRAHLASVSGRYYGMDRDHRWERTGLWYRAAVRGDAPVEVDALAALQRAYDAGTTDEFVRPYVMSGPDGAALAPMRDGDALICFNYRSDRMRQTLRALAMPDFTGFDTGARPALAITTMTSYDETFPFPVAFAPQSMRHLVGEVISDAGLTQLRIAETEKYPHVTFFFNGGRDAPFPGEERPEQRAVNQHENDLQVE